MDTLVIDIETKNIFSKKLTDAQISVVGIYSYQTNTYYCYGEDEFGTLKKLLSTPAILVGFSSNKFDLPILNATFGLELMKYPRIDLSDEVEMRTGRLVGLDALARVNLDMQKPHASTLAPKLYADGKIAELKEYCLNDVVMTKKLFDLVKRQGFLIIPSNHDDPVKLEINILENPALF